MADVIDVSTSNSSELLAVGRRHLAVGDYNAAADTLSYACELLAKEHGDAADQCAEAHLWYGKALLGLAREESGVLGDKIPHSGNEDDEEDEEQEENGENIENEEKKTSMIIAEKNGENIENEEKKTSMIIAEKNGEASEVVEKGEAESTTKDSEPTPSSTADKSEEQPGTSNNDADDESMENLDAEDDVDNLQLAWENLDLSRSILTRRAEGGDDVVRGLLADVHLALGEVALESETYDKAVVDMLSCLEIQKELYASDDRRIAETHYQIALANSLASNFEEAITHFKNAANILETRIKTLETSNSDTEGNNILQSDVEAEIKDLKELLPEIQVKIQDMMDYKTETIKTVRDALYPSNGEGSSTHSNGAGSSSSDSQQPAKDISHLIKRKRKASESEESAPKRVNS